MVARSVSPDTVARNLTNRQNELYYAMNKAYGDWEGVENRADDHATRDRYESLLKQWRSACEDVRQFKVQHPSAFVFEETESA